MTYFYLIASLPSLALDQKPISREEFETRCEAELSARDWSAIQRVTQVPFPATDTNPIQNSFLRDWNNYETQLRNAIAQKRAAKAQRDPASILRPHGNFTLQIETTVESAWNQTSPLEREKTLDHLRWQLLDNLQGTDPFAFRILQAYAVKRTIAERWAQMDEDTGWKQAQAAFEQQPADENRQTEPETAGQMTGSSN